MKTLGTIQADANAEVYAVATGALPDGKPVIVNSNGTVSVVAGTGVAGGSIVNTTVFNNAATDSISAVFDSNSNKIVIAYRDKGNSSHGTAIVGTIANSAITFGSEVVFESAAVNYISASFDSSNNKVIIAYQDDADSDKGKAIVGTVSGTGISFGSVATFNSGTTIYIASTFDSNSNKVAIFYRDGGNSNYGTAIVGTVSNTSISFGSEVVFSSVQTDHIKCSFDSNANKVVVIYEIGNASGRARVGTVSGTGISFGTEATFVSNNTNSMAISFDTTANKFAIFYRDVGNSNDGRCRVATISGTDITFGTEVVFYTDDSVNNLNSIYNPDSNKTSVVYTDGDGGVGTLQDGTISGTDISFGAQLRIRDGGSNDYGLSFGLAYDTNSNLTCISYGSAVSAEIGTASLYEPASINLTSENYIGMSGGAVSYGASSSQVLGSRQVFAAAGTFYSSMAYDPDRQRIIIAYMDSGNSSFATAITGTVSGSSITYAAEAALTNFDINATAIAYDTNSDKAVIFYADDAGGTTPIKCRVTTIAADGTLSFGTEVTVANTGSALSATFDSNSNKVIIAYSASGGKARVGTVSGTDISFGTEVTFEAGTTTDIDTTFDSTNNKVVIAYKDQGNSSYGTAIVGTVSGTDISFGTAVVFHSASTLTITLAFDSNVGKVLVSYKDQGNESNGNARVGTVSGTGISFGTEAIYFTETDGGPAYAASVFDSTANKVIIFASSSSYGGTVIAGTISGTTVSFNTQAVFTASGASDSNTRFFGAAYDSNAQRSVLAWTDGLNSSHGTSVVYCPAFDNTVRGQVASGSSASVDIIGTVSENQTGLTAGQSYFVQTDGTIGLTAGSPSVFAGTAISATKLLVKT